MVGTFQQSVKKHRDEDTTEFDIYFSDEQIAAMTGEIKDWKIKVF